MELAHRILMGGGPINFVILGLYVAVLALICFRISYFLYTSSRRYSVHTMCEEGKKDVIKENVFPKRVFRSSAFRAIKVFNEYKTVPVGVLQEAFDREAELLQEEMEKGVVALTMIATISPLCGLLGTVTGLMTAFSRIEQYGGSVDMGLLSGGIWEAMITTASGLIVAIPAVVAAKCIDSSIVKRMRLYNLACSLLIEESRSDLHQIDKTELCIHAKK